MEITRHAEKKMQQRSISYDVLDLVMKYGRQLPARDGAEKIFFGCKEYDLAMSELKTAMRLLERTKNCVVIEKNGKILTTYKNR